MNIQTFVGILQPFITPNEIQSGFLAVVEANVDNKAFDPPSLGSDRRSGRSTAIRIAALWLAAFKGKKVHCASPTIEVSKYMARHFLELAVFVNGKVPELSFDVKSGSRGKVFEFKFGDLNGKVIFQSEYEYPFGYDFLMRDPL